MNHCQVQTSSQRPDTQSCPTHFAKRFRRPLCKKKRFILIFLEAVRGVSRNPSAKSINTLPPLRGGRGIAGIKEFIYSQCTRAAGARAPSHPGQSAIRTVAVSCVQQAQWRGRTNRKGKIPRAGTVRTITCNNGTFHVFSPSLSQH